MWNEGFAAARSRRGLTQEQAAELLDVTRAYLAKIETGDKDPSFSVLKTMCSVYACEMADLFPSPKDTRAADLAPIMAELYGVPTEAKRMIIDNMAALARSFALGFQRSAPAPRATEFRESTEEINDFPERRGREDKHLKDERLTPGAKTHQR